jgi:putative pyruvate formate lyase activating enzyme
MTTTATRRRSGEPSVATLPTSCELCPRRCGADRAAGERGVCGAGSELRIARAALHEWEEPPISVGAGSGAVFFSNCPLRCIYCQNAQIACGDHGTDVSEERLTDIFFELAAQGAANINLVTPGHYLPQIAVAVAAARARGFDLPFVFNTSSYERAEVLRAYRDCADVYLADFKYWMSPASDAGARYSHARDYFDVATRALDAMVELAGPPRFDRFEGEDRLIGGVVVRHLLLPGRLDESKKVMSFLWHRYGDAVLYSVMNQYTPLRVFPEAPELDAPVPASDYERLLDALDAMGMPDYFWQEGGAAKESFVPAFDSTGVLPREGA